MFQISQSNTTPDYSQIKLKSDAFENGIPSFYTKNPTEISKNISEIHKILFHLAKNKPLSIDIYYKNITEEKYIDTLVELHQEWFPFQFDRISFKKYFVKQDFILIGAFIKINNQEFIVGCVSGEMVTENKFNNVLPGILKSTSSWFSISNELIECGFLHYIGVIDEYRKLSIGTRLLELFVEEVKKRNGVAVYLNVIMYNKSAIKFCESNKWHFYGIEKNYFRINGKSFDSRIYYYVIDMSKCEIIKVSNSGLDEIKTKKEKGCLAGIMGLLGF